jgi:large subunit ribosomal protein L35
MAKQKTRKAGAKRLKKTGTGKFVHFRAGRRHLKRKKNAKRRRRLRQSAVIKASELGRVRELGL